MEMGPQEIVRTYEVEILVILMILGLSLVMGYLLAHSIFRGEDIDECGGMEDGGS
ncbi:hypothetical protein [Thermococcus sp.]|uniref:hypothetical protein n=1 Tax=Thermococcus sp. TaxID=35749 RepID=UPI002631CC87|nr:hypothetical protein [Thermococcus sp.]